MIEIARRCLGEGEVVVGVVEASAPLGDGDRAFLAELRELKVPRVVAVNKIDRIDRAASVRRCRAMRPRTAGGRDRSG